MTKLSGKLSKIAGESKETDPYTYFKEKKSGKVKRISQERGKRLTKRYGKKGPTDEVESGVGKTYHKKGRKAVIKANFGLFDTDKRPIQKEKKKKK